MDQEYVCIYMAGTLSTPLEKCRRSE